MKKLVDAVKLMVRDELEEANKAFPMFRSTHEGYAIILEEVEEAKVEMDMVAYNIDAAWKLIKANQTSINMIKLLRDKAILLAAESIQIAAMAQKFIDSELSEVNK